MLCSSRPRFAPAPATYPRLTTPARVFRHFNDYPNRVRITRPRIAPLTPQRPAIRHFLGWDRPLLFAAVDHFLAIPPGPDLDLSQVVIVTPGRRASRMLIPMLAEAAHRARRTLSPPRFTTPGDLASVLVATAARYAGSIARRIAWIEALRSSPAAALRPLIPESRSADRPERWDAIAEQLERTSDELAGELLSFAEVADRAPALIDDLESERWSAAARIQQAYESLLRQDGLADGPLSEARALAAEVARTSFRVVLIGVVELPAAARSALTQAAASVDSLIAAPKALADRFDELGCILPDAWREVPIDIPENNLIFADGPRAQAAHTLASLAGVPINPTDIAIGIPDPEVAPFIQRLAARTGQLSVRDAGGRPITDSPPVRLLRAVADYLEDPRFPRLASLIRHPDIEHLLLRRLSAGGGPRTEWWLSAFDDYAAESVLGPDSDAWPAGSERVAATIAQVRAELDGILTPLRARANLRAWAATLGAFLQSVYHGIDRSSASPSGSLLIESSRRIATVLAELATLSDRAAGTQVAAARAIRLVLGALGQTPLPPRSDPGAIEMLGWLELPLDPASTVIVTGMNDEHISGASGTDPLLPDSLRRTLGLPSADRRLARDAYILTGLLASRRRCILIAGRRSSDDDPLKPSRLLLAAPAPTMLARLSRFFDDRTPEPIPRIVVRVAAGSASRFPRSPRIPAPLPDRLRVTAFRDYLASPYVFYLRHVLNLEHKDEAGDELDALSYGGLMHRVLEQFGRSDARTQTDPARIQAFLDDTLADAADIRFGRRRPGAVDLQLALLRIRFEDFARRQAAWRSEGWLIERIEWPPDRRTVPFEVDGAAIQLSGRIDRIDRHDDGRIAILDYKSGNRVERPDKTHRNRNGWKDLQLPLYRHLAAELGLPEDPSRIVLGYFALPRDPDSTGVLSAPWQAADLESADNQARDIIRRVRAGDFADIGRPAPDGWVFEVLTGLTFPDPSPDELATGSGGAGA